MRTIPCKTQCGTTAEQQESQFYYSFGRSMRTILRKTQCRTLAEQQKSQFYYSFARSMRTILRKTQCRTLAGQTAPTRNRNFTTVSGDRCARSYGRVVAGQQKSQFYYSFGRSMRTILCKLQGSASSCRTRAGPLKR